MLVNYRPEFTHNWGNKTYYTQLRLDPLSMESGEEMLKALLDDGDDLVPLKRVIIEKTEGNPFSWKRSYRGYSSKAPCFATARQCAPPAPLHGGRLSVWLLTCPAFCSRLTMSASKRNFSTFSLYMVGVQAI